MDKWETKQAELRQATAALDDLYYDYQKKRAKIEEGYGDLNGFYQLLYRQVSEKQDAVFSDIQRFAGDTSDILPAFNTLFTTFHDLNDHFRYQSEQKITEKLERLEEDYKKDYRKQEDKIDQLYRDLSRIDQDEGMRK